MGSSHSRASGKLECIHPFHHCTGGPCACSTCPSGSLTLSSSSHILYFTAAPLLRRAYWLEFHYHRREKSKNSSELCKGSDIEWHSKRSGRHLVHSGWSGSTLEKRVFNLSLEGQELLSRTLSCMRTASTEALKKSPRVFEKQKERRWEQQYFPGPMVQRL